MIRRPIHLLISAGILIYAGVFCFLCGQRGFFAFDQSIVFDGGYRIVSGQIPYRDFIIPFGPVVFWIQALFFKFAGITYCAYLLHATAVNILATACTWIILKTLIRDRPWLIHAGCILTATWFYPPFGTPWMEQTGFAFNMLGAALLLPATINAEFSRRHIALAFLAGVCATASFLSKQNVGLFFQAVVAVMAVTAIRPNLNRLLRVGFVYTAGALLAACLFGIWLQTVSAPTEFIRCVFTIPAAEGASRFLSANHLLTKLWITHKPIVFQGAAFAGACALLAIATASWRTARCQPPDNARTIRLQTVTWAGLLIFQHVYYISGNNSYTAAMPFVGVIVALLLAQTMDIIRPLTFNRRSFPIIIQTGALLGVAAAVALGMYIAMSRHVHDIFAGATFGSRTRIPALACLKWAEPTPIQNTRLSADDLSRLYEYLDRRNAPFFIFSDFTILYGLLGQPSPQPILWFHKGLTYPKQYSRSLDERMVAQLEQNNIRVVVREKASFGESRLPEFPLVNAFLEFRFVKQEEIGIFQLYIRN